jgi:large subunit ribosomal protein L24
MSSSLRTGDSVVVRTGDDKGTVGKILKLNKKKGQIVVEGVNVRTKHVKPRKEGESGQLLKQEMPIHISNVKFSEEAAPAVAEPSE